MEFPPQIHVQAPQYPPPQVIKKGANIGEVFLAMLIAALLAFVGGAITCKSDIESRYYLLPRSEIKPASPVPMPEASQ